MSVFTSQHRVPLADIPSTWIFEYYLGLETPLDGQTVRMRSLLNPDDKLPSLFIFWGDKVADYRYKCFSTNNSGKPADLIHRLWMMECQGWNWGHTVTRIEQDYQNYLLAVTRGGELPIPEHLIADGRKWGKWRVENWEPRRSWNQKDADYWTRYHISSPLLEEYYIRPLRAYTMSRRNEGSIDRMVRSGDKIYGYFTRHGELHKIYQPETTRKFTEAKLHLQGSDNLKGTENLLIMSSMKDGLAFKSLGGLYAGMDFVADRSETEMMAPAQLGPLLTRYQSIYVLLDNDKTGIATMRQYQETLGIRPLFLPLEKDISDSIWKCGQEEVIEVLNNQLAYD